MTTAYDAKKRLIELSKADSAITTALGDYGEVWDSAYVDRARPRRLLWFGETVWQEDEGLALANLKRREIYDVRFGIEVNDSDATQTEANDKVEAILNALYTLLRDYRVMGVAVPGIESMQVIPVGHGEGLDSTGRAAVLAAQVRIKARI